MGQGKKPSIERNSNYVGKKAQISLLKYNNTNRSSILSNCIQKAMPNSSTSSMFQTQNESVYTLQPIRTPTIESQPIINSSMICNKTLPPGKSLLKVLSPSPKIPIQFQLATAKLAKIQHTKSQKSVELDELNTKKIASILTPTPSGTNLTTVNHANRSLVYPEPVSTKGIAPTKNITEISTIDIDTKFLIRPNFLYSSRSGIAHHSSPEIFKFRVPINESLLKPISKSNFNESVNFASFNPSRTNKTHSDQTFDASITHLDNDIHRNDQQALGTEYFEQVNHKCHRFCNVYFVLVLFL